MVQVSLAKAGCLFGFLLLVLLAGTFVVLFTDVGCHGHAANARVLPNPRDVDALERLASPRQTILDSAQKAELGKVYLNIVLAYSNKQVEVLREWRRNLPGRVERVAHCDQDVIERPLDRIIHDDVAPSFSKHRDPLSIMEEYGKAEDFERTAATMLTFLGIYGDIHLRQRNFRGWFEKIEPLAVYWLTSCRDCFRAAGRTDLVKIADQFLAEWIDQIESENGYTRTLVVKSIAYYRVWGDRVMDECSQTWEEVSQNAVRQYTYRLVQSGYTPKWLDEFKDIPRHATRSSGVTRTVLPISGSN